MEGSDLVRGVTCDRRSTGSLTPRRRRVLDAGAAPGRPLKIAAYDYGMKWNILRRFTAHGCDVRVFPATAPRRPARRRVPTASS